MFIHSNKPKRALFVYKKVRPSLIPSLNYPSKQTPLPLNVSGYKSACIVASFGHHSGCFVGSFILSMDPATQCSTKSLIPPPGKGSEATLLLQSAFPSTHWSAILSAGDGESETSHKALNRLCQKYWYPLYVYVRRKGYHLHEAQDLTQEFFVMILKKNYLKSVKRERGRFRSFLLTSMNHFLINEWNKRRAEKRGGGRVSFFSEIVDAEQRYPIEPVCEETADKAFERSWALTLLQYAFARLKKEWREQGKMKLFEQLKSILICDVDSPSYKQTASELGTSEGAVKVAVHRMRRRLREILQDEIARTVANPTEINQEIRCFIEILSASRLL